MCQKEKIMPGCSGKLLSETLSMKFSTHYNLFSWLHSSSTIKIIIYNFDSSYSDNELIVTLWGEHAEQFTVDHLYDEQNPRVIVVLFQGCLAKNIFSKLDSFFKNRT